VIVTATDGELITGNRNAGLASMAGSMRRSGFSASEIYAAIMTANAERCDIPLPLSDVKRIAESIARYEPAHDVGASSALGDAAAQNLIAKDDNVIEKLNAIFGDELGIDYEAPDELVEGLITIGSSVVVYGDSNSGKTFWALSVAASVAMGTTCYGRKTDPGLVVYLASESPTSIRSRVQAIKKHYGDDLENLVVVQAPVNFYLGDGDAKDVIELVRKVEEIKGQSVRLIVGDTLARISAGANENSGEDMGPVMSRFDVVAAETKACMMIIHHNGKDAAKGSRGWSGIRAHIDTEIEVSEKDGVRSVTVTKQRELPSKVESIYFKLEVIEMGRTKFGKPATTCVAVPDEDSQTQNPHKPLTKHDQNVQLLERAWIASGSEMRNNCPYLSRSALIDVIVGDGNSQRTAENKVAPGRKDGLIMPMLNAGVMRPFEHGWIFVNPQQTNAMLMLSNAKS
jgi:KaiC/GvpD/RAD55 family RecA-like ATPase